MSHKNKASPAPAGDMIQFQLQHGMRRITCTVSDDALEAASGLVPPSTLMLRRRSFDRFRTLINVAAQMKLARAPLGTDTALLLTREDLSRVPQETGAPPFGTPARGIKTPA